MIIDGTTEVKIFEYEYDIEFSYDWYMLGNGKYKAADRGSDYDHYLCDLRTHGKEDAIEILYTYLSNGGEMVLTDIKVPIFGNNVDYTQPINVVMEDLKIIEQTDFRAFDINFTVRLVDCVFNDYTLAIPTLNLLRSGYEKGDVYSHVTVPSYNRNNQTYNRRNITKGTFEGVFTFNYNDMAQLLHFQRVNRTLPFTMPTIAGVDYPFGQLNGNTGLTAKLYSVSNVKEISQSTLYTAKLKFVQD